MASSLIKNETDVALCFVRERCITHRSQQTASHAWEVCVGPSLPLFSFQESKQDLSGSSLLNKRDTGSS